MTKRKKKKAEYICFADMEFHCNGWREKGFDTRYEHEILSIGLVIVNQSTKEITDSIYRTIRPVHNRVLTTHCRELTGLIQEEIDRSDDFTSVMREILNLGYDYDKVYVFGNDRDVFKKEMGRHEVIPGLQEFCGKITNVEYLLSRKVFNERIEFGLAVYKELVGLDPVIMHHALSDALDLYSVWKRIESGDYEEEKKNRILREYRDKRRYYEERRFHSRKIPNDFIKGNIDLAREQAESLIGMIMEANQNKIINPVSLQAFCDDLLKLVGMEPKWEDVNKVICR